MKIAIIGAGICGLYLAWKLSERGYKVTVFEKRGKIGKEACSGLFSEKILEFIPESQKLVQNQIDYCLIHFPGQTLKINFGRRFLVMSHFQLDNLVADLAQKAGAKIFLNYHSSRFDFNRLQRKFDRVIGCDGAYSLVRKNLRLPDPSFRLAIQGFLNSPISDIRAQISPNSLVVETWPTKDGFIWKIPREKEIEYGIIERPERARLILEEFLRKNNLSLEKVKSALIPQGLIIPSHSTITLCGDAAGLTKPWSGGGVVWGLMAAEILLKNFPDFLKYQKEIKKFFLAKIIFSKIATKIVYFLGFNFPWILPKNYKMRGDFLI